MFSNAFISLIVLLLLFEETKASRRNKSGAEENVAISLANKTVLITDTVLKNVSSWEADIPHRFDSTILIDRNTERLRIIVKDVELLVIRYYNKKCNLKLIFLNSSADNRIHIGSSAFHRISIVGRTATYVTSQGSDVSMLGSYIYSLKAINYVRKLIFTNCTVSNVRINAHFLQNLTFNYSKIGEIDLSGSSISSSIKLFGTRFSHGLDLTKADINDLQLQLRDMDLTKIQIPHQKLDINIAYAVPIDRKVAWYSEASRKQTYEQQVIMYQLILKQLNQLGLSEKYETQDKLFQETKYLYNGHPLQNWIAKHWWGYGYDKELVLYNSFFLFCIFLCLNIIFFNYVKKVYYPSRFIIQRTFKANRNSNRNFLLPEIIRQIPGIFLYTAFIFWGLKLDLEKLELKNWFGIFLVIAQYVVGIICLAYLANYVLTK